MECLWLRPLSGVHLLLCALRRAQLAQQLERWCELKALQQCMHAHAGFLARGEIHIEYPDGCVVKYKAPQMVAIEPGHDGWVVGKEAVVLIEFDFEGDTVSRLGMPADHRH